MNSQEMGPECVPLMNHVIFTIFSLHLSVKWNSEVLFDDDCK